jgi:DNA-binding CsgD family transcriptional regulator
MSDRDYVLSEHYNEIVRPLNGWHAVGVRQQSATAGFFLGICRQRGIDDFDFAETALLQALIPHFTTAVDFHYRLAAERSRGESLTQLIDRLDTGVILTDGAGVPLFVNARAAKIAEEVDGLLLGTGGIAAATSEATGLLRSAIAAIAAKGRRANDVPRQSAEPGTEERRLVLKRPSGRPPLLLAVLPIWKLHLSLPGSPAPRVAIFVSEPDVPTPIRQEALVDALGLTPRESEVAILLAEGLPVEAIAMTTGLGVPSVREYLKRSFAKTGTHSQAALVALIRGFAEPIT